MLVLTVQAAFDNGYTKIVLGTCTSRIACHVLEATVKVSCSYMPMEKGKKSFTEPFMFLETGEALESMSEAIYILILPGTGFLVSCRYTIR